MSETIEYKIIKKTKKARRGTLFSAMFLLLSGVPKPSEGL